jgi:hypothetical protein
MYYETTDAKKAYSFRYTLLTASHLNLLKIARYLEREPTIIHKEVPWA